MEKIDIVLASGSPRRKELLEREGVEFTVRVSEVDEFLEPDLLRQPEEAAKKLAERKARAVLEEMLNEAYVGTAMVVGADTMVVVDGVSVWLAGAPANEEDISIAFRSFAETSHVVFKELDDELIERYIATGEPMDKAGAYGVQGKGGEMLVERVAGDFDNVVGLPVKRLIAEFQEFFEAAK